MYNLIASILCMLHCTFIAALLVEAFWLLYCLPVSAIDAVTEPPYLPNVHVHLPMNLHSSVV